MSNRLHFAKRYNVQYHDVSAFAWGLDSIDEILSAHDCEVCGVTCENYDEFDVSVEDITRLIKELENTTERAECGIQVDDLLCFFRNALEYADKHTGFVHFAWF